MPPQKETAPEIRVVKRKKGHAGHHGGAWKVAYADFVTAMMAFFLVMWISGLSEPIKQSIAGYFRDPVAFMQMVRAGNAPFAISESNKGKSVMNQQISANDPDELMRLVKTQNYIKKMISSSKEFESLKDFIDVELVDEGLRVDLIEAKESLFFDAASAKIKPAAKHLLTLIAKEVSKLPNKIIFEGHTDPRPLANQRDNYTNWELSADRANSARRVMESAGLKPNQVAQVRGYAATQPKNRKDPNHYTNRRVSIIVVLQGAMKNQSFSQNSQVAKTNSTPINKDNTGSKISPDNISIKPAAPSISPGH